MGGRFPPLNRSQVEAILRSANFKPKRTKGSHTQWEGTIKGSRRIVTVDHLGGSKKETSGINDFSIRHDKERILLTFKVTLSHRKWWEKKTGFPVVGGRFFMFS